MRGGLSGRVAGEVRYIGLSLAKSMTGKPDSTYQVFDVSDEIQQFLTSPGTSSVYDFADRNDGALHAASAVPERLTRSLTSPERIYGAEARVRMPLEETYAHCPFREGGCPRNCGG